MLEFAFSQVIYPSCSLWFILKKLLADALINCRILLLKVSKHLHFLTFWSQLFYPIIVDAKKECLEKLYFILKKKLFFIVPVLYQNLLKNLQKKIILHNFKANFLQVSSLDVHLFGPAIARKALYCIGPNFWSKVVLGACLHVTVEGMKFDESFVCRDWAVQILLGCFITYA